MQPIEPVQHPHRAPAQRAATVEKNDQGHG
jgi:hypothetical protein